MVWNSTTPKRFFAKGRLAGRTSGTKRPDDSIARAQLRRESEGVKSLMPPQRVNVEGRS